MSVSFERLKKVYRGVAGRTDPTLQDTARLESENAQLRLQCERLHAELADLQARTGIAEKNNEQLKLERKAALVEARRIQLTADQRERTIKRLQSRVDKALKLDGKLWLSEPLPDVPAFTSLKSRRTPVLAFHNMKGGVGKTTSTAYLAKSLARKGYRVLLIDLDLQGSLSSLFLSDTDLAKRAHQPRSLIQHYFQDASTGSTPLSDYAYPLFHRDTPGGIIATTDGFANAEWNLVLQWLLRASRNPKHPVWTGQHDPRFFLRRGVQNSDITDRYDFVLLDCPPFLNLACINALIACDYLIIPFTPSRKTIERVPPLLERLKEIRRCVHPDLRILGSVMLRTHMAPKLGNDELQLRQNLRDFTQDKWYEAIRIFNTFVPNRTKIRDCETDFDTTGGEEDLSRSYDSLADDIIALLPNLVGNPSKQQRELFI
jgi:chromosome partitioning protein